MENKDVTMSEIERYNGLTTADKGTLEYHKSDGCDSFYIDADKGIVGVKTYSNRNYLNIDLALAQIAEMESKTMTNRDVYLKMLSEDLELLAALKLGYDSHTDGFYTTDIKGKLIKRYKHVREANDAQMEYFNSPYTEGANQ